MRITIDDVLMSLDNAVGVAGGNLRLLVFGLALTIPLMIWGSMSLNALLDLWRWLVYAGAGILLYAAIGMFFEDRVVHGFLVDSLRGLACQPVEKVG